MINPTLEQMIVDMAAAVRPPERLTVSDVAARHRVLNNPGAYVGPWLNDVTPYLVEPMNELTSREYTSMVFVGPAQSGKALALDTPIVTPSGWTTMGELEYGDYVFGSDGNPVQVLLAQAVQHDHDCYRVSFDDDTSIVADAEHRWVVGYQWCIDGSWWGWDRVLTTRQMFNFNRTLFGPLCKFHIRRGPDHPDCKIHKITSIERTPSVPVRCIGVDADDHLFLAGEGMVPTHNTDMVLNWIGYSAKIDPADMMVVQTSKTTSRDFSMRRIDRLHRHSPDIGRLLVPKGTSDNTFDKHYKSGMMLTLSWPTINELSGKPIPRLWLTDYDRMSMDVDGEGSPFDLSRKRATTFKSNGMCVAESSPGFVIDDPRWIASTRHEAPPTKGVLALYNRGDRRRYYWKCVACRNTFEPDFSLMNYPDSADFMESAELATMRCPHCDMDYHHDGMDGMPGKAQMNIDARWVKDGMLWTKEGEIVGRPIRSTTASFWLKGVAAAFSDWKTLVFNYLTAEAEYAATGGEEALKTTTNTDQGMPYSPKDSGGNRVPEALMDNAKDADLRVVPVGVRFLVATIDVQKNRFVVQIQGITQSRDVHVIDRFDIKKSKRVDGDGDRLWVNPAAYPEDWKLIVEEVMMKSYPLSDGSERAMAVKFTLCDSGGSKGFTANAYNFYRWLINGKRGAEDVNDYSWSPALAGKFLLLKGASSKTAPRVNITYPDSQRKDRHAGARGEIPVLMINTNDMKDKVNSMLDRTDAGGRYYFSRKLGKNFFTELTVEVKDPNKGWLNPRSYRNESWDLLAYCEAALLIKFVAFDHINWNDAPSWADEWDRNDLVFDTSVVDKPFDNVKKTTYDLAKLGSDLA